jgi:hypothetical protein
MKRSGAKQGKVEIRVTASGKATVAIREVTFTVTDTGIGIPDDKRDLLFRAFSQVDESHTRRYGGTGLGLAICKKIVERMWGKIGFMSVEVKGSTFSRSIPFGVPDTWSGAILTPGEASAEEGAPHVLERTRPRLLIAEDDPTIRQVLGSMLQRSNYEICFAENGYKVVEMWESGGLRLILMDV